MIITAKPPAPNAVRRVTSRAEIADSYSEYLSDESKARGSEVHDICFPKTWEEVSSALAENFASNRPTRISGARTGLTGGAVPEKGESVISLTGMKAISAPVFDASIGSYTVHVQAGVTLTELNASLAASGIGYFFPIDPTEASAAFGGMAATDASGARSYIYNSTRNWIRWGRIVLSDGAVLELSRGRDRVEKSSVTLEWNGSTKTLTASDIRKPPTKNTLGYGWAANGDLIDAFIGSEGTLGIFTDLEIVLAPVPARRLSFMQFFPSDDSALKFVEAVRGLDVYRILAIEYFDRRSLELACETPQGKASAPAKLVTTEANAAVYIECICEDDVVFGTLFEALEGITSSLGVSIENSFAGMEDKDLRELKTFRHAVPERINAIIAERKRALPGLHKIATDMAVPAPHMHDIYSLYRSVLSEAKLDFAIFGHSGNSHFHVNILPRSEEELVRAKSLYEGFAKKVVEFGGAVAAEHGIGRLKRNFLKMQYSVSEIENLRKIKQFFDARGLLNRGVLFDAE